MPLMTIGEFAARTRLSAKALRLYDRLGLLAPADVDTSSGYRYYNEDQVADAVLVGLLRRTGMSLDAIATVLDADAAARPVRVRTYWDGVERATEERRALISYIYSHLEGTPMPAHHVELRILPDRHIASINRHILAAEADAFFADAFAALRSAGPGIDGIAGCPFVIYYGEVSDDSDGPIELCRPIADAEQAAAGGIDTRREAAHEEAYVRLRKDQLDWPAMRGALDVLEEWAGANDRQPAATFRQVMFADRRTAAAGDVVCDLSVPLR